MRAEPLSILGAWRLSSTVHRDGRGSFSEWYKSSEIFNQTGQVFAPVQANLSVSRKGVVRGIHYSLAEGGQAKLVTVVQGRILDVIVDVRIGSPTFGQSCSVELRSGAGEGVLLRSDLAHAFQALEDETTVCYLVSSEYNPEQEKEISPICPRLSISWSDELPIILSGKDQVAPNTDHQLLCGLLPQLRN